MGTAIQYGFFISLLFAAGVGYYFQLFPRKITGRLTKVIVAVMSFLILLSIYQTLTSPQTASETDIYFLIFATVFILLTIWAGERLPTLKVSSLGKIAAAFAALHLITQLAIYFFRR